MVAQRAQAWSPKGVEVAARDRSSVYANAIAADTHSSTRPRCTRWPGSRIRSLTSDAAFFGRHSYSSMVLRSTETEKPPSRRTRTASGTSPDDVSLALTLRCSSAARRRSVIFRVPSTLERRGTVISTRQLLRAQASRLQARTAIEGRRPDPEYEYILTHSNTKTPSPGFEATRIYPRYPRERPYS
jgi:hypothetical protein